MVSDTEMFKISTDTDIFEANTFAPWRPEVIVLMQFLIYVGNPER